MGISTRNRSAASQFELGLQARAVFEKKDVKSSRANFRVQKRKGRILGKPSDVIPSLLKSIKEHRRFKQLATYSIDCVTKVVDEIHSNWEANVKECIRENISEAIADVLKLHPKDDHVLMTASRCLSHLAPHEDISADVVGKGAFDAMLGTLDFDGCELHPEEKEFVVKVLVIVTNPAPPTLAYTDNAVDMVISIMNKHSDHDGVVEQCLLLLKNMARNPIIAARIVKGTGLEGILAAMRNGNDVVIATAFDLLSQLCAEGLGEEVKNAGSLKQIVAAMMSHLDNEYLLQHGADLIRRLVGDALDGAMAALKDAGVTDTETFFVMALTPDNVNGLLDRGAPENISNVLNNSASTMKEIEVSCRTIERLATSPQNVQRLLDTGVLPALHNAYSVIESSTEPDADRDAAAAAATRALTKLACSVDNVDKMKDAGCIADVLGTLKKHPDFLKHNLAAMKFITQLDNIGYDMQELVKLGAIETLLDILRANIDDPELQWEGLKALFALSQDGRNADRMLKAGALEHILELMKKYPDDHDLMLECLDLLKQLTNLPEGKAKIQSLTDFTPFSGVVWHHPEDEEIRHKITPFIAMISTDQKVRNAVEAVKNAMERDPLFQYVRECQPLLKDVAMFCLHRPNVHDIMSKQDINALDVLQRSLDKLRGGASDGDVPGQQEAVRVNLRALHELLQAQPDATEAEFKDLAASLMRTHEKFPDLVEDAARTLLHLAEIPKARKPEVDEGGLDLALRTLKTEECQQNPTVGYQVARALELLSQNQPKNAEIIARKGCGQQALFYITAHAGVDGFDDSMVAMVKAVGAMSKDSEDVAMMMKKKLKAMDILLDTMEAYSKKHPVFKACAKALENFVKLEDVVQDLPLIKKVAESIHLPNEKIPDRIFNAVTRLGNIACVGKFANDVVTNGGHTALLDMIDNANKLPSDSALRTQIVPTDLEALGKIADNADVQELPRSVESVLDMLRELGWNTPSRVLEFIESLANHAAACADFVAGDGVGSLLQMLKACDDEDKLTAIFEALAELTEKHPPAIHELGKAGAHDWLADWLKTNYKKFDSDCLAAAMRLLGNLVRDYPPTQLQSLLDSLLTDIIPSCIRNCEPATLAQAMRLLARLAHDEPTAEKIISMRLPHECVKAMRSFPAYMRDEDCVREFVNMAEILLENGGENAAAHLDEQGVTALLRELLDRGELSEDLLAAIGRLLAKLGVNDKDPLLAATEFLEELIDCEELDIEELNGALAALAGAALLTATVGEGVLDKVADVIAKSIKKIASKLAESNLSDSDRAQFAKALATAMQTLNRLNANPELQLPADKLLECIKIVMDQDPESCEDAILSALDCIGQMVAGNLDNLKRVLEFPGLLDKLRDLAANAPTSALQEKARDLLQKLGIELSSPAAWTKLGDDDAARAKLLAALIDAVPVQDMLSQLKDLVGTVLGCEGGLSALLQVVDLLPHNLEAQAVILEAIGNAGIDLNNGELVESLLQAVVRSQTSARAGESPTEAELKLADRTATLLNQILDLADDEGCKLVADKGGVEVLRDAFVHGNEVSLEYGDGLLALAKCKAPEVKAKLKDSNLAKSLIKRLEDYDSLPSDCVQPFVHQCIKILQALADNLGAGELGLDDHGLEVLTKCIKRNAMNKDILRDGQMLLATLGVTDLNLDSDLAYISDILSAADHLLLQPEIGSASESYLDTLSSDIFNTQPQEYRDMIACLEGILEALSGGVVAVDKDALHRIVCTVKAHVGDARVVALGTEALSKLATNADNCRHLAEFEETLTIFDALETHGEDSNIAQYCTTLLDLLAKEDAFKKRVSRHGIEVILKAMIRWISLPELVQKCIHALSRLAIGVPENVELMMELGILPKFKQVIDHYPESVPIAIGVCECLSNLMFDNEDNMVRVCEAFAAVVLKMIEEKSASSKRMYNVAMRALGNMSICTENVTSLLSMGTVRVSTAAMANYSEEVPCLCTAIDLLGNLAVPDSDDLPEAVQSLFMDEGGISSILKHMLYHNFSASMQESGLDALCNMEGDPDATLAMVEAGAVDMVVNILQGFQMDSKTCGQALALLEVLSGHEASESYIASEKCVGIVTDTMATHVSDDELLGSAAHALKRAVGYNGDGREALYDSFKQNAYKPMDQLMAVLDRQVVRPEVSDVLEDTIVLLTNLAVSDELAREVAERGMHIVTAAVRRHFSDTEFLTHAFACWGQLAFQKENLPRLVQMGVITLIIKSISTYPEHVGVIKKCIQVLDNISIASEEYAIIVYEGGGMDVIDSVASTYAMDDEVQQLCKHARVSLLTMTLKARERGDLARDGQVLADTLQNMDSSRITSRILKLRLRMQGDAGLSAEAKTLTGYLQKSSPGGVTFNKRWFELKATELIYFSSKPSSASTKPKGNIILSAETKLLSVPGDEKAFKIETGDRTYICLAEDVHNGREWLGCIQHNLAILQKAAENAIEDDIPPPPPPDGFELPPPPMLDEEIMPAGRSRGLSYAEGAPTPASNDPNMDGFWERKKSKRVSRVERRKTRSSMALRKSVIRGRTSVAQGKRASLLGVSPLMSNVMKEEEILETERIVKQAEDQINELLEIEEFATIEENVGEAEANALEKEVETLVRTVSVADMDERQRGISTSSFLESPTERDSSNRRIDLDSQDSIRAMNKKSPTRTKTVKRASMTSEGNWEVDVAEVDQQQKGKKKTIWKRMKKGAKKMVKKATRSTNAPDPLRISMQDLPAQEQGIILRKQSNFAKAPNLTKVRSGSNAKKGWMGGKKNKAKEIIETSSQGMFDL